MLRNIRALRLHPDADCGVVGERWLDASEDDLLAEAKAHHGSCDDGDLDPADLRWRLVIDLPTSVLVSLMHDERGWRKWFRQELAMFDEEQPGRAETYRSLMTEPLDDPVVVTLEPHRVQIWDGWHRTATRILGRAASIPAIVGYKADDGPVCDLVRILGGRFEKA